MLAFFFAPGVPDHCEKLIGPTTYRTFIATGVERMVERTMCS
jgi:hypothetical protein